MLDLSKLYVQIAALSSYQQGRAHYLEQALGIAKDQVKMILGNIDAFRHKLARATTSWLVAIPTDESPFKSHPPIDCPKSYSALSADGSQISPNRHSPHSAFLINIGFAELNYGRFQDSKPYKLKSEPYLFFEENDIKCRFGGEERSIEGQVLAVLRQKMESEALLAAIKSCSNRPAVAFVDGTLILWSIETDPERLQRLGTDDLKLQSFLSFMRLISDSKELGVPVGGYISLPGSNDAVNALKVSLCPSKIVDCDKCAYKTSGFDGSLPCDKINGVTDAQLFRCLLKDGERSSLFESSSEILKAYGDEKVFFFYLNVGREIARIEVPGWVARNKEALNLLHAICLDQANKGMGYPIVVAEAHEQAVVKSSDKSMFDQLVLQSLIRQSAPIKESQKALRKRGGFI
ncbi:MAG: DNA double-strand break repair nuclease NurA [Actinomycetota bacterium]|nr:DNA double-strand break repair nuclease NurA [Actinomycetota bacterium]